MVETDDEAAEELSSIQAIFPELVQDSANPRHACLDLEVCPSTPIEITFKSTFDLDSVKSITIHDQAQDTHDEGNEPHDNGTEIAQPHKFTHLPALHVDIELPPGYPEGAPPVFRLSSQHDWIPSAVLNDLQAKASELWEEYGHAQVVFAYIDFLQTSIESSSFRSSPPLTLSTTLENVLLTHQNQALDAKFAAQIYDCGVCLYPKKGSSCHAMRGCGHVFCKECLQDFYNNAITEGSVETVQCLDPDCGKDIKLRPKPVHPTELLDIGIVREQVQRHVDLKLKKMLDIDKSIVFCPRQWCQGPAQSAKYKAYDTKDLEHWPEEDLDSTAAVAEDTVASKDSLTAKEKRQAELSDRLRICSKCSYAFCQTCNKSWHGDYVSCVPPRAPGSEDLSAEDKASLEFIRLNTSPCPSCSTPTQKQMGCNHMICGQCETHFCYLCSSWLNPGNPYEHFNNRKSSCHMRLFELEEGDQGQGGAVFAGVRAAEQAYLDEVIAAAVAEEDDEDEPVLLPAQAAPLHPVAPPPNNRAHANRGAGRRNRARRHMGDRETRNGANNRANNRAANHAADDALPLQLNDDAIDREALQRFLVMAAADEEDGWDSDELEMHVPVGRRVAV
ncbi:MAG: hypothetical protein Q9159_005274 [Coniocarpon cinnabarinum]